LVDKYGHFREKSASVFKVEANVWGKKINNVGKDAIECRYMPVNKYESSSVLKSYVMPTGRYYRLFDKLQ
jgi:hypothetical protein